MTVNIHGKEYRTVAERVADFKGDPSFEGFGIQTDLISNADLVVVKSVIVNPDGQVVGSGYAEEVRGSTNINKTSALENCETSAIGRALASIGLGGTQYASANEVSDAIIQQAQQEVAEVFYLHNKTVFNHLESLFAIREGIANNDYPLAHEAWTELGEEIQTILWRAPSKGGYFTTREREVMKTPEFRGES